MEWMDDEWIKGQMVDGQKTMDEEKTDLWIDAWMNTWKGEWGDG